MLSELQRKTVWEGWLASEVRAYYFAELSDRYQKHQRRATWVVLALSSGALATLLSDWVPPQWLWVRPALAALTAAVSAWSLVAQNDKAAIECADLHYRWNKLADEYRTLWDSMYGEDAPQRMQTLFDRSADLSRSAVGRLANDSALINKWQDYVARDHASGVAA
jgi:hypothetical protein